MKTWPAELPPPNISFKGNNEAAVIRTKMDSGRYRQRQRFTRGLDMAVMEWTFTDAEYEIFRQFFEVDLAQGAEQATMEVDLGGVAPTNLYFRFTKGYKYAYHPVSYWKVSGTVELAYTLEPSPTV